MGDNDFDFHCSLSYANGLHAGANMVLAKATEKFAANKDSEAKYLRRLSEEIEAKAQEHEKRAREKHDR